MISSYHFLDYVKHFTCVIPFNLSDDLVGKLRLCEIKELAQMKGQGKGLTLGLMIKILNNSLRFETCISAK